jgi:hypothetical protein
LFRLRTRPLPTRAHQKITDAQTAQTKRKRMNMVWKWTNVDIIAMHAID